MCARTCRRVTGIWTMAGHVRRPRPDPIRPRGRPMKQRSTERSGTPLAVEEGTSARHQAQFDNGGVAAFECLFGRKVRPRVFTLWSHGVKERQRQCWTRVPTGPDTAFGMSSGYLDMK